MVAENSLKAKADLRAPVFTRLRKGIGSGWLRVITLLLLDGTLLCLAWWLAQTYGTPIDSFWNKDNHPLSIIPILTIQMVLIAGHGLYHCGDKRRDYFGIIKSLTFAQILLLLVAFFYQPGQFVSRSTFLFSWLLGITFTSAGRFSLNLGLDYIRRQGAIRLPVFIICPPEHREKASRVILHEKCYNILGWTDIAALDKEGCEAVVDKIRNLGVAAVFVCSWGGIKERMFLYWKLRNSGIMLHVLPIDLVPIGRTSELTMIGGIPSIKFSPPLITGSDFWVKRFLDFCFSGLLLLGIAPLLLFIALLIKLDSPGPIFYKQARVGLHGQQFKVWKFRTMVTNADKLQKELEAQNEMKDGVLFKLKSDPRITRVGKFLRQYSLDELPQLFNVFFGQMSLIGPRPLPIRDVEKMAEEHLIRHQVLPGITGLWQVSGRSNITSFEEVIRLDTFYIENWSLWLDWQILLRTIKVIFQKTGAY